MLSVSDVVRERDGGNEESYLEIFELVLVCGRSLQRTFEQGVRWPVEGRKG